MSAELDEKYRFREEMVDALKADLIGPAGGEHEEIEEPPLGRYIVGALWPRPEDAADETCEAQGVESEPPTGEADHEGAEEGSPVAQARMRFPSSVGMTFSVRASAGYVTIVPTAARYQKKDPKPDGKPGDWFRIPLGDHSYSQKLDKAGVFRTEIDPGLELYRYVRPEREGIVTVSVALNNTHVSVKGDLRDEISWFQVAIEVSTENHEFVDRAAPKNLGSDPDLATAALMYRHAHTFAIGHGCAATWDLDEVNNCAVRRVATTFIPSHEVHRARPTAIKGIDLRMSMLADSPKAQIVGNLEGLTTAYRKWIDDLEAELTSGTVVAGDELRAKAAQHIGDMRTAAGRIEGGVRLLDTDDDALRAFRLANRAMQLQRSRQDWVRGGAKAGELTDGTEAAWRPFQIAYVLLNLPGIVDPAHEDRDIADLLWFPTGGGKTEAYLGLVAFVILLRRIRDKSAFGVAVIMRYTLRLLTIQQFERASMLMCSLETVRKDNPDLGSRRFSIGLWVGAGATPNSLAEAKTSLKKLGWGDILTEKNPVQLTQCPWCGAIMNHENYSVRKNPDEFLRIACGTPACDFRDGLPVHVVDEDVYRERPELVLGTVDKFAMMAWNDKVGSLFARDKGYPPELIIQDELHLISGPLGSMVGLYETAVDAACTVSSLDEEANRARPKVIASTATIRRAEKQIKSVFARGVALFPPPGIDPDTSFFAEPSAKTELGTRRYVGVMASGTSHATLMVRVYAALLQSAKDIDGDDDTRDPYWTLLGYFNSLRVLGSANLQVEGDVRERLKLLAARNDTDERDLKIINELTSRVPSPEIPGRLKQLERRVGGPFTVDDVVLATNMISVGVDIDRLGLMTVMGQPQASAEYIQATSRVGRQHPGLVVTIFNSARSRDRSHYESFGPFHQALYRAVEATSATPFAARARDRGLHGVLIAMARLLIPGMTPNTAAHLADVNWDDLTKVAELIEKRVSEVDRGELADTSDELAVLLKTWGDAGQARENMKYQNSSNLESALMVRPEDALVKEEIEYSLEDVPWPTQQSMRDVDAESSLHLIALKRK